MGSHALLQVIFLTQGLNLGLLHCRWSLLTSEPPGKPLLHLAQGNWEMSGRQGPRGQPSSTRGPEIEDKCLASLLTGVYFPGFLSRSPPGAHSSSAHDKLDFLPSLSLPAPSLPFCGLTPQINHLHPCLILASAFG